MAAAKVLKLFILTIVLVIAQKSEAQNPENWTAKQLLQPSELAQNLRTEKNIPVIISVGPGSTIPNSIDAGMAKDKENLDVLKSKLKAMPKDTAIVIYCGCCPFKHCPNVRPAIAVLQKMKFTSYKLLNLSQNIKADWIDKGYPVVKQ